MLQMIKKSVAASFLISLGAYGLLISDYSYFSMILFAFGLFTICKSGMNLFTGKCGFVIQDKNLKDVLWILLLNLISGYLFGAMFTLTSPTILEAAAAVVAKWTVSWGYFIRACLCGAIMYLAVYLYKEKSTSLGIFFGIPLFILCGFQHSIANVIIMGAALTFSPALLVAVAGNWVGSLVIWWLIQEGKATK